MSEENIKISFTNEFTGSMTTETGTVKIGDQEGGIYPYDLLLGALGSCFYSTFLSIVEKKRLTFEGATLEITGDHRHEVPRTLKNVELKIIIKNPSNVEQITRSAELGYEYCSIRATISHVADIKLIVEII